MFEKDVRMNVGDAGYFLRVRRGACLDKAHLLRLNWFSEEGFDKNQLAALGLEARVIADHIEYFDEVAVLETLKAALELGGWSEDGSQLILVPDFRHQDERPALRIHSRIDWLDRQTGSPVQPPARFLESLTKLSLAEGFQNLPSRVA